MSTIVRENIFDLFWLIKKKQIWYQTDIVSGYFVGSCVQISVMTSRLLSDTFSRICETRWSDRWLGATICPSFSFRTGPLIGPYYLNHVKRWNCIYLFKWIFYGDAAARLPPAKLIYRGMPGTAFSSALRGYQAGFCSASSHIYNKSHIPNFCQKNPHFFSAYVTIFPSNNFHPTFPSDFFETLIFQFQLNFLWKK